MIDPSAVHLTVVARELLEQLAAEAPRDEFSARRAATVDDKNAHRSRLQVERWLNERGVAFHIKAQPDGKGRTVYILKQCPFDPSHTDPDACIMQDADGKMSAHCFHNSCQGRGWQQFKEAIGAPEGHHYEPPLPKPPAYRVPSYGCPETPTPVSMPATQSGCSRPELPTIRANHRQLRDITDEALAALRTHNDPPTLFQRGGLLLRLRFGSDQTAPLVEALTESALRGVLARAANWIKTRSTRKGIFLQEDAPPMDVVKDLAHLPVWDGIPHLEAIVETPVFTPQGQLLRVPGFDAHTRLWFHPAAGLIIPPVPPTPTAFDIDRARQLLLDDLLGDFPFVDDASRAHALAALLLPFVRQMIDGPTPLHLLDSPMEGTGKTLLANCISEVSTGRPMEAISEAADDDEWRKRLTAVLIEGSPLILLDNLNRMLDSGALASLLTARVWKDRVLGLSKTVRVPNLAVWLASGNNTRLSRELMRRTVWCRLDARTDAPWQRTAFQHKNLLAWARTQRGNLVWACLVLCQAWMVAGRPSGESTLGMFESWAQTMGGILYVAEVPGLLANADQFRWQAVDQGGEWQAFIVAWWERFEDSMVGVKELFHLATEENLLDSVLGEKGENSQRVRMGKALVKARDRVFGGYRIGGGKVDHSCRQSYYLERLVAPEGAAP